MYQSRRPRSTSDALSTAFNEALLKPRVPKDSQTCQRDGRRSQAASITRVPALISSPQSDDAHFGLDCDPASSQAGALVNEGRKTSVSQKDRGTSREARSSNEVTGPTGASDYIPMSRENASEKHFIAEKLISVNKEAESSETKVAGRSQRVEVDSETKGLSTSSTEVKSGRDDDQPQRPSSLLSLETESLDKSSDDQARPLKQTESGSFKIPKLLSSCILVTLERSRLYDCCKCCRLFVCTVIRSVFLFTGAVTFDCTPGLVRSVSLITSQPAVKSAARMLALALAESAQQATSQRKRGSSEPPTPVSPLHLHDPLQMLLWPSPLTVQPSKEASRSTQESVGQPAGSASTGSCTDAGGSPQSTCACHGSESGLSCSAESPETVLPAKDSSQAKVPDTRQVPESRNRASVKENVRHVGVGTDNGGSGLETDLFGNLESHSALAALLSKQAANESNFRVILAEASMPASVHDALPAPVSTPSDFPCSPKDHIPMSSGYIFLSSSLGQTSHYEPDYFHKHPRIPPRDLYNTFAPRTFHQSIKHKSQRRDDHFAGCFYRHGGPRYPPMDGASVYPTIRRVRSMHAPPDDSFFFSPQSSDPHGTFRRPVSSNIRHVRPYFVDGKVQYRFKPQNLDQYPTGVPRSYSQSYSLHRMPGHPGRLIRGHNHPDPCVNLPFNREGSFLNQGVSPVSRTNPNADGTFNASVRQRTVARKKPQDPILHPQNLQKSQRWKEPAHIRNKSDSFKDMLISTEGADGKYRVTMVSHYSPEHPLSEPETGVKKTLKQSRSMQNYPQAPPASLTLHKEYSCPDFKRNREDHQHLDVQRLERSHSVKTHQQPRPVRMPPDHDARLSYPAQIRQRTRSMFAPSRTNYVDTQGSVQPKGPAMYPNYGCMPLHRSRLYTTDIGTGDFLRSKLRSKPEVYAE